MEAKLRLICGRAVSGKTHYLSQLAGEDARRGLKVILIVPDQFTLLSERILSESINSEGLWGHEVLSPLRLAARLLEEAGQGEVNPVSTAGRLMLLRKALLNIKDELIIWKEQSTRRGFTAELGMLLDELKCSEIDSDTLYATADNTALSELLRAKLHDTGKLLEAYSVLLSGELFDKVGLLKAAGAVAASCGFLDNASLYVDGFDSLDEATLSFLGALLTASHSLTVTLCRDTNDRRSLFLLQNTMYLSLLRLAHDCNAEVWEHTLPCDTLSRPEGVSAIESGFGSLCPPTRAKTDSGVYAYGFSTIEDEITYVCEDINRLILNEGLTPGDIAVLSPALSAYEAPLRRHLKQSHLQLYTDTVRKLSELPLCTYILSSLKLVQRRYPVGLFMELCKSVYSPLDREATEVLDNYITAAGIKGTMLTKPFTYNPGGYDLDAVNTARERIMTPVLSLRDGLRSAVNMSDAAYACMDYMDSLNCQNKTSEPARRFALAGDWVTASFYEQSVGGVYSVLRELVTVAGSEPYNPDAFTEILTAGLDAEELGSLPSGFNSVTLGDLKRTRIGVKSAVYILGLNEGVIPAAPGSGLLYPAERDSLSFAGINISGGSERHSALEKYGLYFAASHATYRLTLSCCINNSENGAGGQPLPPSVYLTELAELGGAVYTLPEPQESTAPDAAFSELLLAMRKAHTAAERQLDEHAELLYRVFEALPEYADRLARAQRFAAYNTPGGRITPERTHKLYGKSNRMSVTRLESYAACPLRFFLEKGIAPKERRSPTAKPIDIGNLLHTALANFFNSLATEGIELTTLTEEAVNRRAEAVLNALFEEEFAVFRRNERILHLTRRLKSVLKTVLNVMVWQYSQGDFRPLVAEASFGRGSGYPDLSLTTPKGTELQLIGKVDRIDHAPGLVSVVDYKSGDTTWDKEAIAKGTQLQLPLYLDAILRGVLTDCEPGGMFYMPIGESLSDGSANAIRQEYRLNGAVSYENGVYAPYLRDAEGGIAEPVGVIRLKNRDAERGVPHGNAFGFSELKQLIGEARRVAGELYDSLMAGEYPARPAKVGKVTACEHCPYRNGVCG